MKKRLAYSPGTGGEFFARNFLLRHKIPESKVKIAKIQPLALQDAIVARAVDAVATWEPFVTNIYSGLGSDATIFRDPASYTGYMNIAVRNSWSEQHSSEIQGFLLALRDAHDFLRTNQATAQKMLSELIPLPLEVVVATWDPI